MLESKFGQGAFNITDHWEGDLCAVGIASVNDNRQLVYVSAFGMPDGQYYIELENPPAPNSDLPYELVGDMDHIDFEDLTEIVAKHLSLQNVPKQTSE